LIRTEWAKIFLFNFNVLAFKTALVRGVATKPAGSNFGSAGMLAHVIPDRRIRYDFHSGRT